MAEDWMYETPEMRTHRLVQPYELDDPEPVAPLADEPEPEAKPKAKPESVAAPSAD